MSDQDRYGSQMEKGQVARSPSSSEKGMMGSPTTCSGSTLAPSVQHTSDLDQRNRPWYQELRSALFHRRSTETKDSGAKSKTKIRTLESFPMGYPRQAAFADSDDSFMIYRRFGYIHSRLLLNKQDELRELEANLHDMDLIDASSEEGALCLKSRELDEERNDIQGLGPRRALLEKIEQKTLQYDQLLLNAQQLVAFNRPPMRDQTSLRNFMENRPCLVEDEKAFAYEKEDLITLRPGRDHSFVDGFVERMLKIFHCRLLRFIFCSEETAAKTSDTDVRYFTRGRISAFVTLIITMIIILLLVIPIWLLYHLSVSLNTQKSNVICIGVLLVATLVFSAVLSLFTKARRHEILAASAGYCAILVVFIGNVGNASMSQGLS